MASVYISYSHDDRSWKDKLKKQLAVLERNKLIQIWDDEVDVGDERGSHLARLNDAHIVVMLITVDFLTQDHIMDQQVPMILQRRQKEGMRVFPIIVKPCNWREVDWLAPLQVAPRDCTPIAKGSEYEIEEALAEIANEIHQVSKKMGQGSGHSGQSSSQPVSLESSLKYQSKDVFISYAWGGDSGKLVDKLDKAFHEKGISIVRDLRDLGFKGRIKAFMERLGKGSCVIVVISDKYLRSKNCMFELIRISEAGNFADRIFPIVLPDAGGMYDPLTRIGYIRYWEEQIVKVNEAIHGLGSSANLQGIHEELNLYTEIRGLIERLMAVLKDMNTLTAEIHSNSDFETLFNAVSTRLNS